MCYFRIGHLKQKKEKIIKTKRLLGIRETREHLLVKRIIERIGNAESKNLQDHTHTHTRIRECVSYCIVYVRQQDAELKKENYYVRP